MCERILTEGRGKAPTDSGRNVRKLKRSKEEGVNYSSALATPIFFFIIVLFQLREEWVGNF